MKLLKQRIIAAGMLLAFSVSFSLTSAAIEDHLTEDRWFGSRSRTVYFRYDGVSPTWSQNITEGAAAWNDSSAVVSIVLNSSSENTITVAGLRSVRTGVTRRDPKDGHYEIELNIAAIQQVVNNASTSSTSFQLALRGVAAHEFGHVFCLNDFVNPDTPNISIMNYERDHTKITKPTSLDVNTVNDIYEKRS